MLQNSAQTSLEPITYKRLTSSQPHRKPLQIGSVGPFSA